MRLSPVASTMRGRERGLTLIELVVTMALFTALFFIAAPDFRVWIDNTRVRTVSEALQNGVRQSQAEAVRRNRTVVFFLTNDEPALGANVVANGVNWGMRTLPLFPGDAAQFIRGGAFSDVAPGVAITGPATICFNAAGQQVTVAAEGCAAAQATYDIARQGVFDAVRAERGERRFRVVATLGGRVRMCDRDKVLSAANPDGC